MSLRSAIGSALRAVGLHRVTVAFTEREKRARFPKVWREHLTESITGDQRPALVAGSVDAAAVPVVMCLWNRPHRLPRILDLLEAQQLDRPVRLVLWNNRPENTEAYLAEIARRGASGAIGSIEFHESPVNLGGVARFVIAHNLERDGYDGPFVTYDDDIDVSPSFVADLLAQARPLSGAGWWAWSYGADYWARTPVEPGEEATYVGTGAAVFDTAVVASRDFFDELPTRYGFLEDMWSSYWVTRHGGRLTKVATDAVLVEEHLNQHHALVDLKPEFGRYLRELEAR